MDESLKVNQVLWDAWTPINAESEFYDVSSFRTGERAIRLSDYEREEIGPVDGKSLLHLQCHIGLDTLSWARLGAKVTGADFSEKSIEQARALSAEVDIPAEFVVSDIYDLPDNLKGEFDVVYTSRGVLGWLPDVERWARVAAHFVKPGGIFYITEIHPVLLVMKDTDVKPGETRLHYPYWTHEKPLVFETYGSYANREAYAEPLPEHAWDHSLGEIVTALIAAGLQIEFLHEFDFVDWGMDMLVEGEDGRWRLPPDAGGELPLMFSIRATRPETTPQG
jgi:SAM-dependent methyltransferase